MTYGLTSDGFVKKRQTDIKSEIEADLKTAFGDNISLIPQSVFGQIVGIFSEREAELWDMSENVYLSQYPSTAQGDQLSNVVMFNGITRQEATSSTATLTLTGTDGTIISAGASFSTSDTKKAFLTDSDATISGGTATVTATAEFTGATEAVAGTITVIDNPLFGLDSVTNATDADVGSDEETDAELRERRELSTVALGQNLVDALFGRVSNLDGVTDALVISNGTDAVDANGIPAHQFLTVVRGGTNADIANAVWINTPQGILSFGSITEVITDSQGFQQNVKFSRPTDIDIYFDVTVTTDTNYPVDGDAQIKAAIATYGNDNFSIGDDIIYSQFYTPINSIPGVLTVVLKVDTVFPAVGTSNITISADEIGNFDTSLITVTS